MPRGAELPRVSKAVLGDGEREAAPPAPFSFAGRPLRVPLIICVASRLTGLPLGEVPVQRSSASSRATGRRCDVNVTRIGPAASLLGCVFVPQPARPAYVWDAQS